MRKVSFIALLLLFAVATVAPRVAQASVLASQGIIVVDNDDDEPKKAGDKKECKEKKCDKKKDDCKAKKCDKTEKADAAQTGEPKSCCKKADVKS